MRNGDGWAWPMKLLSTIALAAVLAGGGMVHALDDPADNETEVQDAIDAGVLYLLANQDGDGCWRSLGVTTGVTALAMLAIINSDPAGYAGLVGAEKTAVDNGTTCLLARVQGDGSIHDGFFQTYNTSIATWALAEADQTAAVIAAWTGGRGWLLTHQQDLGAPTVIDSTHDGGWTYSGLPGGFTEHSNSSFAAQGLAATGGVPSVGGNTGNPAAFLDNFFTCQQNRLPACGTQTALDGGFIYSHQGTKGGSRTSHTGSGVFALLLAGVPAGDGRIVDGLAWLDESLNQNPGSNMLHDEPGIVDPLDAAHWFPQGDLAHYTQWAVTKAYELAGVADDVDDPSNWFYKLADALIHSQQADGGWPQSGREDRILATSFSMLTLERVTPPPPCPENPDPATQGYWHRQCLGLSAADPDCPGIDPGRNGRGPQSPTEPNFCPDLHDCAHQALEDLGFFGETTCEGLDADPPSDKCEKALKQLTALILNVCSGRLQNGCQVDTTCESTSVGDLIEEVAQLIQDGFCNQAAECAGAVNEGDALADGGGAPETLEPAPEDEDRPKRQRREARREAAKEKRIRR